ncbi:GntR family transcriptional regulator [Desulfosarcina alkanivorans]|uniref:GntR family transcriptional regulator n=1 Tax=Desulfosarcina alkanivorans TaxID=571177 RepID=A0A5K7Z7P1_9BACT|nr:FadR/GntR family transcriptional regulator [Desulfosarcina alkanivorans]BBO72527.1 GntR family transcriptional regulator [Desulfosarcina alkanivorans]
MNEPKHGNDPFSAEIDLKAVKRTKVYQEIAEQIIHLIKAGKLRHGDQLPPERRLAEIFQVSRHPVREAIRTLEEKNVLVSRVGSGTFVVNERDASIDDLLTHALEREKNKLAEIFEFRRMIEPQIAAKAAAKASPEDLAELKGILERQEKAGDIHQIVDLDQEFHMALARATRNSTLLRVVERLNDILDESRTRVPRNTNRAELSLSGHASILRAVEKGDSGAALKAMEKHLLQVEAAL